MITSENGLTLIKEAEGCVLHVYKDVAGLPTIGVGHLIKAGEHFTTITQAQADALLAQDILPAAACVSRVVTVHLTQNQFDALVSFTFNLGCGALTGSTLLKLLNSGNYAGAADQFLRWNKAEGRVVQGLTTRRETERTLFLS